MRSSLRIERRRAVVAAAAAAACLASAAPAEAAETLLLLGPEASGGDRLVREDQWAAALADALGLGAVLPAQHRADDVFGLLCADRAELVDEAGRRVPARAPLRVAATLPARRDAHAPQRAVVSIPATALYQIAVQGVGPQRWSVDGRAVGHVDPSALGVGHLPAVLPLAAGPHELAVTVTPRTRAERVEVTAFRPICIAPADGWRAERALSYGAKARTLVHAMRLETRLPLVGEAIAIEGERYARATGTGGFTNRRLALPASGDAWATAADGPSEFGYRVRLPEPGLYTLLARVHGRSPQIWSVDGRYRLTLSPEADGGDFTWTHVFTLPLGAGEHVLRALLPRGAGVDLLRMQRRRSSDGDYLAVLDEAGFREGAPDQPVTTSAARANLEHPFFVARADAFLPELASAFDGEPLALVERELEDLYSRPLSPMLPPEL